MVGGREGMEGDGQACRDPLGPWLYRTSKHKVPGPSWMPRVRREALCDLSPLDTLCIFWVLEQPPRAPSCGLALASTLFHSWARPQL